MTLETAEQGAQREMTPEELQQADLAMTQSAYARLMQIALEAARTGGGNTFVVMTENGYTVVGDEIVAVALAEGLPKILPIKAALVVQLIRLVVRNESSQDEHQVDEDEPAGAPVDASGIVVESELLPGREEVLEDGIGPEIV